MVREELVEGGMVIHKLLVVYERRVLTQLLSYLGMAAHEPIHVRQFPTRHVAIAAGLIFAPVKALFLPDEPVRILTQLFAYFRMLLQILLQVTVPFNKFLIVYERGLFANLLRKLWMPV